MNTKFAFLTLLLLNFHSLKVLSQEWFDGSLVLANSEVLVGQISLERNYDLVLYQRNNSRMVYPAHKLTSIFFYDKAENINRRFISLKENDGTHSRNYLYEVVVAGEVIVLRKLKAGAFFYP